MNGYNYANNNPVMMIDSDGNLAWWIVPAVSGAAWEVGSYLWQNRGKKISYRTVACKALYGAGKGILQTGVGRVFGIGSKLNVGKKFFKNKSKYKTYKKTFKKTARSIGHNAKANWKSLKKNPKKHLSNTVHWKQGKSMRKATVKRYKKIKRWVKKRF
ncbi:hypothetical protein [Listeria ivanovii]|uniref:hypothetical protein n=1 Tax=Listeria ivanovii TaxID=1638 RepID=UPI00194551AD|nr:hypothetical protein [Listeria ivanovii]MBM5609393.1 hypothetical protein [Listeria ivanovii]MBM5637732.1 hypothetical protein [Listeria ivanovii]MBM5707406.1 hypothetical protein [Listeria ivanovii]